MSERQKLSKTFYKVSVKRKIPKNDSLPFRYTFFKSHNKSKTISRLRTSHSLEFFPLKSLLYSSIYKNNMLKMEKIKNMFYKKENNSSSKEKYTKNIYKDYLHKKMLNNMQKIKNISRNDNTKINLKTIKIVENKSYKSLIDQKINDEIYRQYNMRPFNNYDYDNCYNNYKNNVKRKSLLKYFLQKKKENYFIKNEEDKNYKNYFDKIINLSNKFSHKKKNVDLGLYLKFLQKKIYFLKIDNFNLLKEKNVIIKSLKVLLESITEKSNTLCECIRARNLLICLREGVQISQMPQIFTFFNKNNVNNYLKNIQKNIENYNYDNENNNNYIPNNLYKYLKSLIKDDSLNSKSNCIYINYLSKQSIFFNEEEFHAKYKEFQFNILQNNENYLNNFNNINNLKRKIQKIKIGEKSEKHFILKEQQLKNKISELKEFNEILKKNYLLYYNSNNNKNKKIQLRNLETYSKEIKKDRPIEESKFYFNFIILQKNKKFKIEYPYVYYLISKNFLSFFNIFPNFFNIQTNFDIKKINESINNINNCDNIGEETIKLDALYLLSLYETALLHFLQMYKTTLNKVKCNNEIILIKREILTNKNYELIKFQKILEEYLSDRTKKNIFLKYNKINLIKRNNYPNYSKIIVNK